MILPIHSISTSLGPLPSILLRFRRHRWGRRRCRRHGPRRHSFGRRGFGRRGCGGRGWQLLQLEKLVCGAPHAGWLIISPWTMGYNCHNSYRRKFPSYGRLSLSAFPSSCQPHHHVNHPSSRVIK